MSLPVCWLKRTVHFVLDRRECLHQWAAGAWWRSSMTCTSQGMQLVAPFLPSSCSSCGPTMGSGEFPAANSCLCLQGLIKCQSLGGGHPVLRAIVRQARQV